MVRPVDQQINFVLPYIFPLKFSCDHFNTTIIHKSIFFNRNITISPYLEMLLINMIQLFVLFFSHNDHSVWCCFSYSNISIALSLFSWVSDSYLPFALSGTQNQISKSCSKKYCITIFVNNMSMLQYWVNWIIFILCHSHHILGIYICIYIYI